MSAPHTDDLEILSELHRDVEVAEMFQTTTAGLAQWRFRGTGPRYVLIGRKVFYSTAALSEFIASRERTISRRTA